MTRSCSVVDSSGAASCLSLIFWQPSCKPQSCEEVGGRGATLTLPSMSLLTGVNATEPSTSAEHLLGRSKEREEVNTKESGQ
jgi:hypothetical protein